MALNPRENINGVTPQDLNKMNNNFMSIWKTLFGGLDFSDTNKALKKRIQTQQMPVQGEGNFDKNFPLYVRFFVPSNTKSITSTSFNMICERYRMDSSIAMSGGGKAGVSLNISLSSASGAVASVSGGGSTSYSGGGTSSYVNLWGNWNPDDPANYYDLVSITPSFELFDKFIPDKEAKYQIYDLAPYGSVSNGRYKFAPVYKGYDSSTSQTQYWLDLATVQHKHNNPDHYHSLPSHSHDITMQPHSHSGTGSVDLPDHLHNLNEGIKISSQDAQGVVVKLNGNTIANMDSISNNVKNNINAKDFIKIGEWNVLECTTTNLARITIYGIIELVMNY